ncbi:MAG: CapA family protein [Bacteroidaceae bacterium]|nr:CapA family protein [Bacteroidaceae bacterium]
MRRFWSIITLCIVACLTIACFVIPIVANDDVKDPTNTPETSLSTEPSTTPPTTEPPATEPEPTEPPTEPEPHPEYFTLTFVGDCTLGTMPDWESYSGCFNNIVKDDYKWPFANVIQYFESDDCTFINLESVLADSGKPETKKFTFKGPVSYINILTQNSVEFANLSNNHTYDFGEEGYQSTIQALSTASVAYTGREEYTVYTTTNGLKIGVYGVYFALNEADMKADVQAMKDAGAEIIVAAVHWGIEKDYDANSDQIEIAHKLIDAGVNIVWGHHPHVLQPIEKYNNGIIYYSLGNFSFGGNHNPSDKDTAVLQQQIIRDVDGSIKLGELTVIPCSVTSVTNYNDFKPTPMAEDSESHQRVLKKLGLLSSGSTSVEPSKPAETPDITEPNTNQPEDTKPSETPTEPSEPTQPKPEPKPEKTLEELIDDGTYMLRRSFGFYRGDVDMGTITKITFTRTAPKSYDEKWYANLAQTKDIMGYRCGTEVYIVGEHIYTNTYSGYMFARLNSYDDELWGSLQEVEGLELLNMSHCTRTPCMFYEQPWNEINGIENWDMSNVTDVTMMFSSCLNLTTVEVANWDVSNVKKFNGLFQGHSWAGDMKLVHVDVSKWNTSSAIDMSHMFYGCAQLTYIPLENWDVSSVKKFSHTFADCYNLQPPNLSQWDTSSVENFDAMFNDCRSFVTMDVSGLDTQSGKQFSQMFEACTNLTTVIGIEQWDVSNASKAAFQQMFHQCQALETLDLSQWNATPDDTAWMFRGCNSLTSVNLSGIDMSQCTWVEEMFGDCTALQKIIWKQEYDFTSIEGCDIMYKGCAENIKHIYTIPTE